MLTVESQAAPALQAGSGGKSVNYFFKANGPQSSIERRVELWTRPKRERGSSGLAVEVTQKSRKGGQPHRDADDPY